MQFNFTLRIEIMDIFFITVFDLFLSFFYSFSNLFSFFLHSFSYSSFFFLLLLPPSILLESFSFSVLLLTCLLHLPLPVLPSSSSSSCLPSFSHPFLPFLFPAFIHSFHPYILPSFIPSFPHFSYLLSFLPFYSIRPLYSGT